MVEGTPEGSDFRFGRIDASLGERQRSGHGPHQQLYQTAGPLMLGSGFDDMSVGGQRSQRRFSDLPGCRVDNRDDGRVGVVPPVASVASMSETAIIDGLD